MIKIFYGSIGLFFLLTGFLQAAEQRGALVLNKIPIYEFEDPRKLVCTGMYDVRFGRDVPDMREFRNALCQGRYEMTLTGEKGRTITLYAQFKFGRGNGFLVVRKMDDQKIWISDLERYPSEKWVTVPATSQSGAFQVFYREGELFDQNIFSLKWGQWWQGPVPQ
ncbi:MAG: hypothetical protein GWM98_27805 [Nitrospinaceae bacterium]|nr:hypothetical protein [Nitrospinaceae bacterium]NIR57566.1 hypothetical protein [Nitrospinaceae bacterium]NIS88036.1 hypothetical protein [Nitrospinaceae bacterium]NIT84900.1 hypothetical protein [Nitrospinaceae bacterium]NIU47076.1 hypothetical protein [Nitrospinaceae bacterium]